MNDKLYKLISNLLLSLAFSCIFAGATGYIYRTESYYIVVGDRTQITQGMYDSYEEDIRANEIKFNSDLALAMGLVSFGTCYIFLLMIRNINLTKKDHEPTKKRRISLNQKLKLAKLPKEEQERLIKEYQS